MYQSGSREKYPNAGRDFTKGSLKSHNGFWSAYSTTAFGFFFHGAPRWQTAVGPRAPARIRFPCSESGDPTGSSRTHSRRLRDFRTFPPLLFGLHVAVKRPSISRWHPREAEAVTVSIRSDDHSFYISHKMTLRASTRFYFIFIRSDFAGCLQRRFIF